MQMETGQSSLTNGRIAFFRKISPEVVKAGLALSSILGHLLQWFCNRCSRCFMFERGSQRGFDVPDELRTFTMFKQSCEHTVSTYIGPLPHTPSCHADADVQISQAQQPPEAARNPDGHRERPPHTHTELPTDLRNRALRPNRRAT